MTKDEYLKQIDEVIANGKYKADWASLAGRKTPDWYYRGKFGIFIHWGIYSVPAYGNEWYPRAVYTPGHREHEHHIKKYGDLKSFGYKDFIPMFTAEKFSADEWVSLFRESGAKYVMPVCEHHDGFAMYETEFNRWKAPAMGPKRDVVGEIKAACDEKGLVFCGSTHRAEHYFFLNMGRLIDCDVNDEEYADFYGPAVFTDQLSDDDKTDATNNAFTDGPTDEWMTDWMVRTLELVDRYQPQILYFDWWIHNKAFKPYLKKIAAYYYNRAEEWGKEVTINYKHQAFPDGTATFDVERGALTGISPVPWQTDTAIGKCSWGYTTNNEYKNSRQIICDLIDIVSKNGMLLLNIGPRPDGTITEEETQVLRDIGAWMKVNSEGIYDTVPWKTFGEGEVNNEEGFFKDGNEKQFTSGDWRFTYKNCQLYAFCMRPSGRSYNIKSLKIKGRADFLTGEIAVLGGNEIEKTERNENGLSVTLKNEPASDLPLCFRIEIG